jgi:Tol biopolymer transport system component
MMQRYLMTAVPAAFAVALSLTLGAAPQEPPQTPPAQPPSQGEIIVRIDGPPGLPPRLAVPEFIPLTNDADTVSAAKTISQVLWDDLNFEREFYLVGRDTYKTIPAPASLDSIPLDRWKEIGVDGLLVGTVAKTAKGGVVQVRLVKVNGGQSSFAREYSGSPTSLQGAASRQYAHTIADEVHLQQRGLNGVARTKIAFTSDRDGDRIKGPVQDRGVSNPT